MNTVKFNEETIDQRRDIIKSMLSEGVCTVTFTKVNGETREMPCTLKADMLPPQKVVEDEEKTERKTTQRICQFGVLTKMAGAVLN